MRQTIDKALGGFLAFIMAVMVINVTWQVASRYLFNDPSTVTEELARFLMIWMGFLGAAFITGKRMHPAIDRLLRRLNGIQYRRLNALIQILIAVFALAVLVIGGSRLVWITHTLEQTSASLGLPLSAVYIVIPVSGLFMIYYSLANIKETPTGGGPND
jgi:TRAP-type C4-dicarboxylate transport system permease small subunit